MLGAFNGRVSALVRISSGNDYQDLYLVTSNVASGEFERIQKFKYAFTEVKTSKLVELAPNKHRVDLVLAEPRSSEAPKKITYGLTLNYETLVLDTNTCVKNVGSKK